MKVARAEVSTHAYGVVDNHVRFKGRIEQADQGGVARGAQEDLAQHERLVDAGSRQGPAAGLESGVVVRRNAQTVGYVLAGDRGFAGGADDAQQEPGDDASARFRTLSHSKRPISPDSSCVGTPESRLTVTVSLLPESIPSYVSTAARPQIRSLNCPEGGAMSEVKAPQAASEWRDLLSSEQVAEMDAAAQMSVRFRWRYPASDESCPKARWNLTKALSMIGMSDDGMFAASVYFAELFANAILHHEVGGEEQVHVAIHEVEDGGRRWVGIAVTDAGRGAVRSAAQIAPSREGFGRGLEVVRGMGARLTDVRVPGGYTVTAWTPVSDELRCRVCQCDCRSSHGREPSACSWLTEEHVGKQAVGADMPAAHLCSACLRLVTKIDAEPADKVGSSTPLAAGR